MKEEIFADCFNAQQESGGKKPYWNGLYEKYKDAYNSKEALRGAFKREKRERIKSGDLPDPNFAQKTTFESSDDEINIRVTTPDKRFTKKEDIIEHFEIDMKIWEIEKFIVKTNEAWRKDRSVSWHVQNGKVQQGDVEDNGNILIVPIFNVEVRFIRKKKESSAKEAIAIMKEDASKFAPEYPKINYKRYSEGMMFEPSIPDVHFGRESWDETSHANYDIDIAEKTVLDVLENLLSRIKADPVSTILLPLGNDFFNVDNHISSTTRGTFQDEDTIWQRTFRRGRMTAIKMIDMCSQIAPVEVKIVPGNHDTTRAFFLGDSLECWYNNNPNVKIDNLSAPRKYYCFGKNLIGFTHGHSEKLSNLPMLMAIEQPENWGKTLHREFHTGHLHQKRDMLVTADESNGILVRILRALAEPDAWTFNKGFLGQVQSAEGFLWDYNDGVVAQFTAKPRV